MLRSISRSTCTTREPTRKSRSNPCASITAVAIAMLLLFIIYFPFTKNGKNAHHSDEQGKRKAPTPFSPIPLPPTASAQRERARSIFLLRNVGGTLVGARGGVGTGRGPCACPASSIFFSSSNRAGRP